MAFFLLSLVSTVHATPEILTLFNPKEFKCLVKNIYYESRGEVGLGQEAVAVVTLNRVKSKKYPNTVCATVYQPYQFSWTLNKTLRVTDEKAWKKAEEVAYKVLTKNHTLSSFKALYFHADYVKPNWGFKRIVKIGNHVFY